MLRDLCPLRLFGALMLSPEEWSIVVLSLKVGGAAVLATLPLAFAIAWALARYRFPGRLTLDGIFHLPLVLPPVVTGWLLVPAFGPLGPSGLRLPIGRAEWRERVCMCVL